MKSQITLTKQQLPFTQVPNALLCNPDMSGLAKSLWCVLYSKPDSWIFYWNEILINFKEGKKALSSAKSELEKFGYLITKQKKIPTGRGKEWVWGGMDMTLFFNPILPLNQENQDLSPHTPSGNTGSGNTRCGSSRDGDTDKYLSKQYIKKKDLTNKSSNNSNSTFSFLPKKKFLTLEEAKIYKKEKSYLSDVEAFIDYYHPKGWKGIIDAYAAFDAWERKFLKINPPKPEIIIEDEDISYFRSRLKHHFLTNQLDYDLNFHLLKTEKCDHGFIMYTKNKENKEKLETKFPKVLKQFSINLKAMEEECSI